MKNNKFVLLPEPAFTKTFCGKLKIGEVLKEAPFYCIGNSIFSRYNAGDGLEGVQAPLPRGDRKFHEKFPPEGREPLWKIVCKRSECLSGFAHKSKEE